MGRFTNDNSPDFKELFGKGNVEIPLTETGYNIAKQIVAEAHAKGVVTVSSSYASGYIKNYEEFKKKKRKTFFQKLFGRH